jgi:hypothetical protein
MASTGRSPVSDCDRAMIDPVSCRRCLSRPTHLSNVNGRTSTSGGERVETCTDCGMSSRRRGGVLRVSRVIICMVVLSLCSLGSTWAQDGTLENVENEIGNLFQI